MAEREARMLPLCHAGNGPSSWQHLLDKFLRWKSNNGFKSDQDHGVEMRLLWLHSSPDLIYSLFDENWTWREENINGRLKIPSFGERVLMKLSDGKCVCVSVCECDVEVWVGVHVRVHGCVRVGACMCGWMCISVILNGCGYVCGWVNVRMCFRVV